MDLIEGIAMQKKIIFTGHHREEALDFLLDTNLSFDSIQEQLKEAIIARRQRKLKTKNEGTVEIVALYKKKDPNNEIAAKPNFRKITNTKEIRVEDQLYVSIRPSEGIKLKKCNRGEAELKKNIINLPSLQNKIMKAANWIAGDENAVEDIKKIKSVCDDIIRSSKEKSQQIMNEIKKDYHGRILQARDQNQLSQTLLIDELPTRFESMPYLSLPTKEEYLEDIRREICAWLSQVTKASTKKIKRENIQSSSQDVKKEKENYWNPNFGGKSSTQSKK